MPRTDRPHTDPPVAGRIVWDKGVRTFHWLLLAAVAAAAWTGFFGSRATLDLHLVAAAAVGVLVVFRLVWGFTGTTYARFAAFLPTPRTLLRHLGELRAGTAPPHVGHNPVGAAMIMLLLAGLIALGATGLLALGGALKEGPLAPSTTFADGDWMRRLHELIAYGLMVLVLLHVVGVLLESRRTRESLIAAMLTGRKPVRAVAHAAAPVGARPWLAAAVTTLVLAAAAAWIARGSLQPALGVPRAPLDAAYAKECGSCHSPHHPSVAPAATWAAIMTGLDSHFGDNAELSPEVAQPLARYLAANAAEQWDTAAANRLRQRAADEPLRITATDGWKRIHRGVQETAFKSRQVAGRLNCSKCHADAESGRFAPRRIEVPRVPSPTSRTEEKK